MKKSKGNVFNSSCDEAKQISLEETLSGVRVDVQNVLKSMQPSMHTKSGEQSYTIDQIQKAMMAAISQHLRNDEEK